MNDSQLLEYTFIRTEYDNQYTIFLKIPTTLLDQDVDINLNTEKQLTITTSDNLVFATKTLEDNIYASLANSNTLVIFTDNSAKFLAEQMLNPLLPSILLGHMKL